MKEKEKINGFDDRNIEKTIKIIKENNKRRRNDKRKIKIPPFLRKIAKDEKQK